MSTNAGAVEKIDNSSTHEGAAIELRKEEGLAPAAEALRSQAVAMVQARVALAQARPRDVMVFRDRLLKDCKRPTFADEAIYSKPIGRERLEGPSIRFAEACLRHYGNMLVEVQVVSQDDDRVQLRCLAMDLETNATDVQDLSVARFVERKNPAGREVVKTRRNSNGEPTYTVRATDDEVRTEVSKNSSLLRRNRILAMMPADIVEEAIIACNKTCADRDAKDPLGEVKKLVDAFSAVHVSPADVKDYLGHDVEKVTPKEVAELRAIYNGLKSGEGTWADVLSTKGRLPNSPAKKEEPKGSKADRMAAELKEREPGAEG
jgi:hypothetical protein